jgi:dipeptidyl aminopeptidase/acylaminoacyl peptidase
VFVKGAGGTGPDEEVFETDRLNTLEDFSADGRLLVYSARGERSLSDLFVLSLGGERRPVPFLQTAFNKTQAQVSPDGRWIAYTSYESGGDEVYVESFPVAGSRRQVSVAGGVQPRWRPDGRELFYLASDQRLMAVPIRPRASLDLGAPVVLFKTRLFPHGSQSLFLPTLYDVAADGQRFVSYGQPEDAPPPITVVLDWTAALE